MADRAELQIAQPQSRVTDDLRLLLDVLPARIREPIEQMPIRLNCLRSSWTSASSPRLTSQDARSC